MTAQISAQSQIYQGEFGQFSITAEDRLEVIIYRSGLFLSALSFFIETIFVFLNPSLAVAPIISTGLFLLFTLGLGISLSKIHIYLIPLHNLLKLLWAVGTIFALVLAITVQQPIVYYVYTHPVNLLGVGFIFVALTGIFFKEAFCFNRLETKFLTPLVPMLLLGHLAQILSLGTEKIVLGLWAILYLVFALRKAFQRIPDDIGDKSVFEHLKKNGQLTMDN
jgi:uncharacterized integral membrane protein